MSECKNSLGVLPTYPSLKRAHNSWRMARSMKWYFIHLQLVVAVSIVQVPLICASKFDYETASTPSTKSRGRTSQTALTECHLQVECTAPQPSHLTANDSESLGMVRKIRIPVRAARGPQGPRGVRGPAGPPGPPGFSPEINEDIVASEFLRQIPS